MMNSGERTKEAIAMNPAAYRAAADGAALFDLSDHGKIVLTGRDARSFLHNMSTQDINSMAVGDCREAFFTTNKARVIAHVWITAEQTASGIDWLLDMVPGQCEKLLAHLNRFLISEQVELSDQTSQFGLLRLVGPRAEQIAVAAATELHPRLRRQLLLRTAGLDLFCPASATQGLKQRLIDAGAVPGDAEVYQTLRIEAGLPEYGIDIDENRLAMEAGRTAQAISYNKGCYLGQETIVMARDRGQVNRMLVGIRVAEGAPLPRGAKLFRGPNEVGEITSSIRSERLGWVIALAYVRRGSWDPGTELVIEPTTDGRKAVVCPLPFVP
jgi:folate-binding protein YgfZ